MPIGFPPQPIYPVGLDTDETLFQVYNTTESKLTANNAAWSTELSIEPVGEDEDEIWADNGFANISGELFYYDAVQKDSNGKVFKLKKCVRNLGGKHTKNNKTGEWVRGFVVAEHHKQLATAVIQIENFLGTFDCENPNSLICRLLKLQEQPTCVDDHECPNINFDFSVEESENSCEGAIATYALEIQGNFTSFRLDFGDGNFTTTSTSGMHTYAPNATIDPVVTVANDKCEIVQTPINRDSPEEPTTEVEDDVFDIPIPTFAFAVPSFPDITMPETTITLPQIVAPCFEGASFGPIEIPDSISVEPPIPSIITFVPDLDIPSTIEFINIPDFNPISFDSPPVFSPISFGPAPTFSPITFDVAVNVDVSLDPVGFEDPPSFDPIGFEPPPTIGPIIFSPVSIIFSGTLPTFDPVTFTPAPSVDPIQFAEPPSIDPILFDDPPVFEPIGFDPTPEFDPITFVANLTVDTDPIGFEPPPTFDPIPFDEPPSFDPIPFEDPPSFDPIPFDNPPEVSVDWGTPPPCSCTVVIECPASFRARNDNSSGLMSDDVDSFIDAFEGPSMTLGVETLGIPEQIKIIAPEIPIPDTIEIKGSIPDFIELKDFLPKEIILRSEHPIPEVIRLDVEGIVIPVALPEVMPAFTIDFPDEMPMFKVDTSDLTPIQVVGIPETITVELKVPDLILRAPEDLEIPLVYKGPPLPVQIDLKGLAGEDDGESPCFTLVPCPRK